MNPVFWGDDAAFRDKVEKDPKCKLGNIVFFDKLFRADGTLVPAHWSGFREGEDVIIKNYTFKVKTVGESYLLLEPMGPIIIENKETK